MASQGLLFSELPEDADVTIGQYSFKRLEEERHYPQALFLTNCVQVPEATTVRSARSDITLVLQQ